MIKPFQRVCRYILLLKELIKNTPETWEDYSNLQKAILGIESIIKEANEIKRVLDNEIQTEKIRQAVDIVRYLSFLFLSLISFPSSSSSSSSSFLSFIILFFSFYLTLLQSHLVKISLALPLIPFLFSLSFPSFLLLLSLFRLFSRFYSILLSP